MIYNNQPRNAYVREGSTEHIPKPKRNSFWIVGYLGLPGARSQISGVDNQELTAHVDISQLGLWYSPEV